jgi:hypothetical protein
MTVNVLHKGIFTAHKKTSQIRHSLTIRTFSKAKIF